MAGSRFTFWVFEVVAVSSGFLGVETAEDVSGLVVTAVLVVAAAPVDGGAGSGCGRGCGCGCGCGGGCGKGDVGSRITGFVTGGPSGVVLYRFPFGFRIPIELNLLRTTSTQSSITSRELQANLKS